MKNAYSTDRYTVELQFPPNQGELRLSLLVPVGEVFVELLSKAQRKRRRRKLRDYEGEPRRRKLNGTPDPRRHATPEMKKEILDRDGYTCRYCGAIVTWKTASIDHVIPWFEGGITDPINLVTACKPCNSKKGPKLNVKPRKLKSVKPEIEISSDIYAEEKHWLQHLKNI